MPKEFVDGGTTSQITEVYIHNLSGSAVAISAGTPNLTFQYKLKGSAAFVSIDVASVTTLAVFNEGGIRWSGLAGFHELHTPDACTAANFGMVTIYVAETTSPTFAPVRLQLQESISQSTISGLVSAELVSKGLNYLLAQSVSAANVVTGSLFAKALATDANFANYNANTDSQQSLRDNQGEPSQGNLADEIASLNDLSQANVATAVWNASATEPTGPIAWGSANRGQITDWVGARNTNRHHQSSTETEIYSSAGAVIASASVALTSTSANVDQWLA